MKNIGSLSTIKGATTKELQQLSAEVKAEILKRETKQKVIDNIFQIMKEHDIELHDLDMFGTKRKQPANEAKRKKIAPKYINKETKETWTGRGRAPKWVSTFCESHGITLADFKTSNHIQIKKQ